jgi:hypothetical protein
MPTRFIPRQIEGVEEAVAAILRQRTPAQRVEMAAACHRTARALIGARLRSQHPEWTDEQLGQAVARRLTRGAD